MKIGLYKARGGVLTLQFFSFRRRKFHFKVNLLSHTKIEIKIVLTGVLLVSLQACVPLWLLYRSH